MSCPDDRLHAQLDEYVDGTLSPLRAAAVERHLDACPACRDEVRALRALLARAAGLPDALSPAGDPWTGIAARIAADASRPVTARDTDRGVATPVGAPRRDRRRVHAAWAWSGWLAAAACLALLLLAPPDGADRAGRDAAPFAPGPQQALLAALREWEAGSLQAQHEYVGALRGGETGVPADAAADIARNLQALDLAIAETRAALLADPGSAPLARLLATFYGERIALLGRATRLTVEL